MLEMIVMHFSMQGEDVIEHTANPQFQPLVVVAGSWRLLGLHGNLKEWIQIRQETSKY